MNPPFDMRLVPLVLLMLGCGPPFARIEETTFAAALDVDLSRSSRLPQGVYVRDVDPALPRNGTDELDFTCVLADGTEVRRGRVTSRKLWYGQLAWNETIAGFQIGTFGTREWSARQLIVPPELAYGDLGASGVPPNAILIFLVEIARP